MNCAATLKHQVALQLPALTAMLEPTLVSQSVALIPFPKKLELIGYAVVKQGSLKIQPVPASHAQLLLLLKSELVQQVNQSSFKQVSTLYIKVFLTILEGSTNSACSCGNNARPDATTNLCACNSDAVITSEYFNTGNDERKCIAKDRI